MKLISIILAKLDVIAIDLTSAINLRFTTIVVESDSKGAIDLIMLDDQCFNEFSSVLVDIVYFANKVDMVFSFVPHICNQVANELARHVRVSSSSKRWDSLFPD